MTKPSLPSRRLGTLKHLAAYRRVSERTARNWAKAGYFPLYRMKGIAGVVVDLDEAEAALDALPPGAIRPNYGTFGGQPVRHLVAGVQS